MHIIGLADIHGQTRPIGRIARQLQGASLVLLLGDLTDFGGAKQAARVVDAVARHNPNVLAVPGNCDTPEVGEYLAERGVSLDRRSLILNGVVFLGLGGSLPCPGRTPNEHTEEQLAAGLGQTVARVPDNMPMVLVSHQPPYNTVTDLASGGGHVGSRSVREFISQRQPLLCLTGHIHEGRGTDAIGACQIVNPGPLREGRFAYAEVEHAPHGPRVKYCEIWNA